MQGINSPVNTANISTPTQIDALKKSTDVQANQVLSALESIAPAPQQQVDTSALTGLGQQIDIKA